MQRAREIDRFPFRKARWTYIPTGTPVASGLLIAAPRASWRHEAASCGLTFQLLQKGYEMGLKKNLRCRGSATTKIGHASSEPDTCFCSDVPARSVVIEVANSESFASVRVKCALWCQLPTMKAVVTVETDTSTNTITVNKVVPEIRDTNTQVRDTNTQARDDTQEFPNTNTQSGASLYPRQVASVVIRPAPGVPGAYEVDPGHDLSIELAYDDLTSEAPPPTGKKDFVLDAKFFCEWAAEVWEE